MKSTIGRPRALTDRQVEIILVEHGRRLAWKAFGASLKSQRELARELGVSQGTISHVIRILGHYKQVSPDRRARAMKRRTGRLARLRARGLL
jgi:DNA-binding CsgD family transcriptional regulator